MVALAVSQPHAAVYVRVSDPKQESNYSLPTQEERCRAYAAEHGFAVVEVYRETHTAAELWQRPELGRLREALDRRELDALIVFDPDRFSRKQIHSAILQDICERAGAELRFAEFEFTNDATGQFMLNARVFAAELEREKIIERTQRGKRARVLAGKLSPSSVPLYGYRWEDDTHSRYAIDPATAPVVRRMFAEAAAGHTLRSIACGLTDDGIPTARGKQWDFVTVRYMLRNEAYKGKAYAYRTRMVKEPGRAKPRKITLPREEWIELPDGTIPPIVSPLLFDAVQERLDLNRQRASRNASDPEDSLLRGGYVKCGYCGWAVSARKIRGEPYYSCKKQRRTTGSCLQPTIAVKFLDEAVWNFVSTILTDPALIERELRRLQDDDPTQIDLSATDRALAEVTRRQRNLLEHLADIDDPLLAATVKEKLGALTGQRRQLEQERLDVLARRKVWEEAERRLADVQEWCRAIGAQLHGLTYAQKRLALDALDIKVRLYAHNHEPRYVITAGIPLEPAFETSPDFGGLCVIPVKRRSCGNGRPSHCRPS